MNESNNSHENVALVIDLPFEPILLLHQNQSTQLNTQNALFDPMILRLNGN